VTKGGREQQGQTTSTHREERVSSGGLARAEVVEHADDKGAEDVDDESRRLSQEELRQLRERAQARLTDPEYQRRLKSSDGVIESLIKKLGR
jgi:ribosomal protein S12 methylthiotransferase accessory factor YcaO